MSYNLVAMETFGEWLRRQRKSKGWTQDELHKRSGVSGSYISTLERQQPHSTTGARLRPEPDKVEKLAKALGVDIDEARILAGYAPLNIQENEIQAQIALMAEGIQAADGFEQMDEQAREEYFSDLRAIAISMLEERARRQNMKRR